MGPRWKTNLVSAIAVVCDLDDDLGLIVANSSIRDQVWLNDRHGLFSRIMNITQ